MGTHQNKGETTIMNRTILYLTRKKGKSITLFILIFLISIFVTTSLALIYTTNQVSRFMRESVGARIEIRQLPRQRFMDGEESTEVFELPPLTEAIINQIIAMSGIDGHNAYSRGIATAYGLIFRRGINSSELDNMGSIRGVSDSLMLADFRDDRLSLVAGRHIAAEDKNVIMISETLAMENNLTIGDILELHPAAIGVNEEGKVENTLDESVPSIEAKVIGIYAEEEVQIGTAFRPAAGIVSNQMFADHSTMTSLGLAYLGEYEAVTFYVNDPSELPRIVNEIWHMGYLDWDYFFMQHDDGDYMRISSDLQTTQNLIMVLLVAIGIVSAIILALILILRMRGRIHEVGILLSVGISKKQILGGFLLEIAIIAMFAFTGSYAISSLITPTLKHGLLADLPTLADLAQLQFQPMPLLMYSFVYLLILVVILTTAYSTTRIVIRLKPKEILSKMS